LQHCLTDEIDFFSFSAKDHFEQLGSPEDFDNLLVVDIAVKKRFKVTLDPLFLGSELCKVTWIGALPKMIRHHS